MRWESLRPATGIWLVAGMQRLSWACAHDNAAREIVVEGRCRRSRCVPLFAAVRGLFGLFRHVLGYTALAVEWPGATPDYRQLFHRNVHAKQSNGPDSYDSRGYRGVCAHQRPRDRAVQPLLEVQLRAKGAC